MSRPCWPRRSPNTPILAGGCRRNCRAPHRSPPQGSAQGRALIRPHAVIPAVLHARVFGGEALTRETVIASFVEGSRVRADALSARADLVGGDALGQEVRNLLVAHPPPVRAEDGDVIPALQAT